MDDFTPLNLFGNVDADNAVESGEATEEKLLIVKKLLKKNLSLTNLIRFLSHSNSCWNN